MSKSICHLIGCSGMSNKCPDDPNCSILKKLKQTSSDISPLFGEDCESHKEQEK